MKEDNNSEFRSEKERLWVEILNKSQEEELKIDRGSPLGFVVIGPQHWKFKHETETTTTKKKENELRIIENILVQAKKKKGNFAVL